MKLRHELALITWDDAGSIDVGWEREESLKPEPLIVHSIGFVAKRTRKEIVLATNVGTHEQCHHQFRIPRKMIVQWQTIAKRGAEFPATVEVINDTSKSTAG